MFLSSSSLYSYVSKIRFTEIFYCQIEKGNLLKHEWHKEKEPKGKIEFFVPYAKLRQLVELKPLTLSNIEDFFAYILQSIREKLQLTIINGGDNLEIEEYGRTDLDTQLTIFSNKSKFPIRKVISRSIDDYHNNRFCFRLWN